MGHPGNWSERKRDSVQAQNVRADREALRGATFEEVGEKGWLFAETHPCFAYRQRWTVYATCMGCSTKRHLDLRPLQTGPLAHAPFPRVMASLSCVTCGSCANTLDFERREGARTIQMDSLIARTSRDP